MTVPPFTAPACAGTGPFQEAGVAAEAGLMKVTAVAVSASTPTAAITLLFSFI